MPKAHAALILLAASAALAQVQERVDPLQTELQDTDKLEAEPSLPFWVETKLRYIHQFDADIDNGGDFAVDRANAEARFLIPFSRKLILDTDVAYEFSNYDFSAGGNGLASTDPWDDVSNVHIRPLFVGILNDKLTVLGAPTFDWFGEHGADIGDTFTLGALGAVRYQFNDKLALGIGLQVQDRLESSPIFAPIFIVNYQPTEDLLIRTNDFNIGTGSGSGIEALYTVEEGWRVGAGFQVQYREFRLDNVGVAPKGVGSEFSVPIYARLDYLPTPKITLSLFAGTFVAGNLELRDNNGFKLADEDYDPAFGLGIQFQGRF